MIRRVLLLGILAVVCAALPLSASAADTGTISGTVSNGTPGGGTVAGLKVTLSRYQAMNLLQDYTATVDDSGHFSFTDLPINSGEAYIARVTYLNVEYPSQMVLLDQDPNPTADIKVYETTTDSSVLTFVSRGVVISGAEPDTRVMDVFEIFAVDNNSDRTYLGNNGEVLRIPLPDGAAQIEPQPGFNFGDDARIDRGQLVTTGAVPPGQQNAMLGYSVPYSGTSASIKIGTAMPTETLRVLVRDNTYQISSPALNDVGVVDVDGDKYRVLSVDRPIVGDIVTVSVSDLPKAGASGDSNRGPIIAGIVAVAALAVAGPLVYQILRVRRRKLALAVAGPVAAPGGSLEDKRLELAAELNELDDELANGKIDQDTYRRERADVLEELRSLSLQMRGLSDAEA